MAVPAFLTATSASVQTWAVPSNFYQWNSTVEVIGPGGAGSARISAAIGGVGGGAGSYAKKTNMNDPGLVTGGTAYYLLPLVSSGIDAWFNDLNLLQQSQTFANAFWTANNSTVGTTVTAPDGTTTGLILTETAATGNHQLQLTTPYAPPNAAAGTFTFSIYAKLGASADRRIYLAITDTAAVDGFSVVLNLATGAVGVAAAGFGTFSNISGGIKTDTIATGASGNGWYRCFLTGTTTANAIQSPAFGLDNAGAGGNTNSYAGNGTSSIQVWGAQFNFGALLKPYTVTTTTALFSALGKAGTNATITVAGIGQAGSQGDVTALGGSGFKPASGAVGGGGGGAGGPNGAGSTSASTTGGAADNSTVAGSAAGVAGLSTGTEFDASHGCGSGAGGGNATNGFAGGNYGGGGSGADDGLAGNTGGAGGSPIIVIKSTPPSLTVPNVTWSG
jgi:hypothetical protein